MARGQQKIQSQQKAAEKAAKLKKAQGQSKKDNEKTAAAGLKSSCSVCKVRSIFLYLTMDTGYSVKIYSKVVLFHWSH